MTSRQPAGRPGRGGHRRRERDRPGLAYGGSRPRARRWSIGDLDPAAGKAAADEVGGLFVPTDVTSDTDVENLFQQAFDTYGAVDIAFNNAGISPPEDGVDPGDRAGGVAQGAGGQPDLGVPVLQDGDPVHAAPGQGLDHQHRLVRRGDGRGDVADLLLRVEGRRARDEPRAGRRVRPAGDPGQRAVPGAGEHAAAAGAVRRGPRARRSAGWCTSRWAASASPRRSPRRSRSWPATTRRSSPPTRSWSTAASPARTSPPSDSATSEEVDGTSLRFFGREHLGWRQPGRWRVAGADEAVFRPVRAGNPFEETVERLLQAIKLGVVGPGERLPVRARPGRPAERQPGHPARGDHARSPTPGTSSPAAAGTAGRSSTSSCPSRRRVSAQTADPRVRCRASTTRSYSGPRWRQVRPKRQPSRALTDAEARAPSAAAWPRPRRRSWPTTAGWTPGCTWRSPRSAVRRR